MDYTVNIKGYTLEYIEDGHIYLVDGIRVPSITEILALRFGKRYDGVSSAVLTRASEAGTKVHEAIERYCKTGEDDGSKEVRNFRFLQRQYGFKVLENEVPVILFNAGYPLLAGRLDLVIEMNGRPGGADIKRTSTLDKEYLAYQLNLYRIAYRQSYDVEWEFLKGIHLRDDTRRFIDIPICEELTKKIFDEI